MNGQPEPPRSYLGIHAVNVFVRDQERSLSFYRDQLGFTLAFDARLQTGQRWLAVSPPDGSAVLNLIAPDPDSEQYKLIGRPTDIVIVTEDVAGTYLEWTKRGVRFRHTPRLRRVKYQRPGSRPDGSSAWGGVFTRFEDIDHNSFALVSFDEVTRDVEATRRALAQKVESERRLAQELEIAKQVQGRLFPQSQPSLKTLEYAGLCIQAREVGGDYYDFLNLGLGRLGLVIGDVSGKGIAAALLMANLQANLRSLCAIALDQPQKLLQSVNQLFCENTADGAYATLFFAEYDDGARRLRYANCGHLCALLLRHDGALERLHSTATVLGLFKEWHTPIEERQLSPGDTLVLYTDGVTEACDEAGNEFGEKGVTDALLRHRGEPSQALLNGMVSEIRHFSPLEQRDDVTVLVAQCRS